MTEEKVIPKSFWIISTVAVLWNLIGVANFLMSLNPTPDLTMYTPEQQAVLMNVPAWARFGFGTAVFAGLGGSLGLLLRRKWAMMLFALSLLGILIQDTHAYIIEDSLSIFGAAGLILPLSVLAIGIFLLMMSRKWSQEGLLR